MCICSSTVHIYYVTERCWYTPLFYAICSHLQIFVYSFPVCSSLLHYIPRILAPWVSWVCVCMRSKLVDFRFDWLWSRLRLDWLAFSGIGQKCLKIICSTFLSVKTCCCHRTWGFFTKRANFLSDFKLTNDISNYSKDCGQTLTN